MDATKRNQPARTICLTALPTDDEPGVVVIHVGKETFPYFVDLLGSDYGRAFSLQKFDGTSYTVNVGDHNAPPSCDCAGYRRWGHKTVCKHVAGVRALVAAGKL